MNVMMQAIVNSLSSEDWNRIDKNLADKPQETLQPTSISSVSFD